MRNIFLTALALAALAISPACTALRPVPEIPAATTTLAGKILTDGGGTMLPTFKTKTGMTYMLANAPVGAYVKGQAVTLRGRLEVIGSKHVQRAMRKTYGSGWKEVQVRSAHQVGGMVFLLESPR